MREREGDVVTWGGRQGREMSSREVAIEGDVVAWGFRVERREKGGKNFIKDMMIFSLNNGRCRKSLHLGKHLP